MAYINRNYALNQLEVLVETAIQQNNSFFPDSFNTAQLEAIEIFKKRIFLESIIEESISFNKNLSWENRNKNLSLATTAEELIEVFKLRSDIYAQLNYQKEFPDIIEGLNLDEYDKSSAIIYYKTNSEVTGTTRLIFDSPRKLPTEKRISFNFIRERYNIIGEVSRLVIRKESKGLNLDFKNLMQGLHNVFNNNKIDITASIIKEDHYKLYSRLGGITREIELNGYGNLNDQFLIFTWDLSKVSKFFKKGFLKE